MKSILIINSLYRMSGGENSNIYDEIRFFKNKFRVSKVLFENNKLNFYTLISFFTFNNFQSNKLVKTYISEFNPDLIYLHNPWFSTNLGVIDIIVKKNIDLKIKFHNFRYYCGYFFLASNHLKNNEQCPMCGLNKSELSYFNKYYEESYVKSFLLIVFNKAFVYKIIKNNIKLIVLSKIQKEKFFELGVNSENITQIYNPTATVKSVHYNVNSNFVVYAGRLSKSKGIPELIETWEKFNPNSMVLKIVGDGDLAEYVKSKSKKGFIEYEGALSHKDVINLIKDSRAVITATKMYECQPKLLNEATSMGIPCIFPKFGTMENFFPTNYLLSFKQYDYSNLLDKLKVLEDTKLMIALSEEVYIHTNLLLNPQELIRQYSGNFFNE